MNRTLINQLKLHYFYIHCFIQNQSFLFPLMEYHSRDSWIISLFNVMMYVVEGYFLLFFLSISFIMCICENHWRSREKILQIGQDAAHSEKIFILFPLYSSSIIYRQIVHEQWKTKYTVTQYQCLSWPWLWDMPPQGILEHVFSAYTYTSLPHSDPAAPQCVSW